MSHSNSSPSSKPPAGRPPGSVTLLVIAALGLAQLAWAGFLWQELISHRSGGPAFCGFASLGDCTALWDSPFASGVRAWTGMPVAAWGVAWGIAATALPGVAWWRRRTSGSIEPFWSGTVLTGLAGAAGVLVLLAASLQFGEFCTNCAVTYALVAAYAGVATGMAFRSGPLALGRGALAAAAPVGAAYLILLYPALQTPAPATPFVAAMPEPEPEPEENVEPEPEPAPARPASTSDAQPERRNEGSSETEERPAAARAIDLDKALARMVGSLQAPDRQALADALHAFKNAPDVPARPARGLIGPPDAEVRLTEFADMLCSHCASLHEALASLRGSLPAEAFSIEPRYFPLDGRCNPNVRPGRGPATRCVAAKVMICASGQPQAFELAGRLFQEQQTLTPERIFELADPLLPDTDLRSCVDSDETTAKLDEDIEWATEHGIQGTPLILLDGRSLPPNNAIMFALLLSGGDPDHPAFADLPPPRTATSG